MTNNTGIPTLTTTQADELLKAINPQKIINDNADKLKDVAMANAAYERAEREPLPAVTEEAFDVNDILVKTSVGSVKIRKMKAMDITIFKLTDSPFYKLFMGDINEEGKSAEVFKRIFPNEELLFEVVYQFTHDIKDVYKLIKKNKEVYHDTVLEEVGFIYTTGDILLLVEAIMKHIGLVNNARVSVSVPETEEDKKK